MKLSELSDRDRYFLNLGWQVRHEKWSKYVLNKKLDQCPKYEELLTKAPPAPTDKDCPNH